MNAFFMKHIFPLPAEHPICVMRILTIGLMAAPSTRQFYTYITDTQCKRLGTQCWVFIMITASELILSIKFGRELFSHTQLGMVVVWLVLLVLAGGNYPSVLAACLLTALCYLETTRQKTDTQTTERHTDKRQTYRQQTQTVGKNKTAD